MEESILCVYVMYVGFRDFERRQVNGENVGYQTLISQYVHLVESEAQRVRKRSNGTQNLYPYWRGVFVM